VEAGARLPALLHWNGEDIDPPRGKVSITAWAARLTEPPSIPLSNAWWTM
jgi:hypothetical protein